MSSRCLGDGDASLPLVMVLLAVDTQYNTVAGGGVGVRLLLPLQAIRTAIGEVTKPLTASWPRWMAGWRMMKRNIAI